MLSLFFRLILVFFSISLFAAKTVAEQSTSESKAAHWPAPYILELKNNELVDTPVRQALLHIEAESPSDLSNLTSDLDLWRPNNKDSINLGMGSRPAWVSFTLHNATDEAGTWIVSSNRATMKIFEMYVLQKGQLSTRISGARSPEAISSIENLSFMATKVTLEADEYATVYIRFKGRQVGWLPISVGGEVAYAKEKFALTLWSLASFIGIATLVLVNFFYFISTRLYTYFYYCLAEIFYVVIVLQMQGFTTRYFFYQYPDLGAAIGAISLILSIMLWLVFAIRFFDTKEHYPKLRRVYYYYNYVSAGVIAVILASFMWAPSYLPLLSLVSIFFGVVPWLVLPVHALHASIKHGPAYSFVAPAWFMFSIFLVYSTLSNMLLVPELPMHWLALGPLGFVEALLISIALANRVRIGQKILLKTKTALADSLKEQLETQNRETALAQQKALALQELVEKSKLVLAASHDTRHMLGAIRQFSSGIRNQQSPEKLAAVADQISDISDMLEHIQSMMIEGAVSGPFNSETYAIELVSAPSLLESIALIHNSDARAAGATITIRAHTLKFTTDRVMVTRILSNLLANAIKYSGSKRILLTIRPYKDTIRCQVWDQGCGISGDQLQKLLDHDSPSIRLDNDSSGTGNGLRISQHLATQLSGQLTGHSEVGKGSVFTLSLPLHHAPVQKHEIIFLGHFNEWHYVQKWHNDEMIQFHIMDAATLKEKHQNLQKVTVIFDPAATSESDRKFLYQSDLNLCIATFDRTILSKGEWTNGDQNVIYKPLARECVSTLLSLRDSKQKAP